MSGKPNPAGWRQSGILISMCEYDFAGSCGFPGEGGGVHLMRDQDDSGWPFRLLQPCKQAFGPGAPGCRSRAVSMARHQRLENIPDGPCLTAAFVGQDSLDGAMARRMSATVLPSRKPPKDPSMIRVRRPRKARDPAMNRPRVACRGRFIIAP
jgi:hypothetical protein